MIRAFQWDIARQVERLDVLKRLLPRYAEWGYQELYLHLEDAVHYPSLPDIGRVDAYSHQQLGELAHAATRSGIGVVPIVNLLGHTQYLIKDPGLRDLNELRDAGGAPLEKGQICPLHPRTLEVAEKLLRNMLPYCTAGKVHVGLDESFHLGKCPRCRAEVARLGLAAHFAGHVQRLHALCTRLGLAMGLWADMLYFVPEAIPLLPRGLTAYDWYYYPFTSLPRVEMFNFAERDLAAPLKKHGIRYYGCPMNGAFRHEPLPVFGDRLGNVRSWWRRCTEVGADGLLVTSWEANRLALETTVIVDAAAAGLWLRPEEDDAVSLLAGGLTRLPARGPVREMARALLQADAHAFSGYARWQINERWDASAGMEGMAGHERERAFFARLLRRADDGAWPAALRASLRFRLYLAERDVFVRRAARAVFRLRRLMARTERHAAQVREQLARTEEFAAALRRGRQAARTMWRLSRDPGMRSPNETVLRADAERLTAWRRWLRAALRHPGRCATASPVAGAWQFHCWVHNPEPAVQRVSLEQQQPDGSWREVVGRHTIEFRAAAARPQTRLKREFSAPVDDPDRPLRLVVRGAGRVQISHVCLTDGIALRRASHGPERKWLGKRAPRSGLPDSSEEVWRLRWRQYATPS